MNKEYTEKYMLRTDDGEFEFPILVKPGTDLEDMFKAWDPDAEEFITVNGWQCELERIQS